jgi:hypothetical protein
MIAAGFGEWSAAISDGLRHLHGTRHLPEGTDPDDLAVTLLAAVQDGPADGESQILDPRGAEPSSAGPAGAEPTR